MKYSVLTLILFINISFSNLHSQIWEEVSTPYDYRAAHKIISINDEVFVSSNNLLFQKSIGESNWKTPESDTLRELFGKPYLVEQSNDRIFLNCRNGTYISEDSANSWSEIVDVGPLKDASILGDNIFAVTNYFIDNTLRKFNIKTNKWDTLKYSNENSIEEMYIREVEANSTLIFAMQERGVSPIKSNDTIEGGLYISKDEGMNWEKTLKDSSLISIYATDNILLACTKYGNLLRSEDNGKTWEVKNIETVISNYFKDGERLLASSHPLGIIESKDNGKTWVVLNSTVVQSQIFKDEDKYYFIGFANILFESNFNFQNIKKTNLIINNSMISQLSLKDDSLFAAGYFKRGIVFSNDYGISWDTYNAKLDEKSVVLSNIIYNDSIFVGMEAGLYNESLYISEDNLNTIEYYNFIGEGIKDIVLLSGERIIINGANVRILEENGKSFKYLDTNVIKSNFKVDKIVRVSNGDLLLFTGFNGVYKSADEAKTWTKLIDSLSTDTSFARVNGFYEFDNEYFITVNLSPRIILKSSNKGETWEKIGIPFFENNFINSIKFITPTIIIVSTNYNSEEKGFYISYDQGSNWIPIDDGLPTLSEDLLTYGIIGSAKKYLYIVPGYRTSGFEYKLYRTTLDKLGIPTSVESEIERNYLYTLPPYPLPSQNEVKVQFYWDINLPMTADDISVYDITGRKLITKDKIRLEKQADHYGNLIWDCSGEEPGIYLINIKHGTEESTIKVVVE